MMPVFETTVDSLPGAHLKYAARCFLRTPGNWDELSDEERALWNAATSAINELMWHYAPKENDTR